MPTVFHGIYFLLNTHRGAFTPHPRSSKTLVIRHHKKREPGQKYRTIKIIFFQATDLNQFK
jgi:hypothetical protein